MVRHRQLDVLDRCYESVNELVFLIDFDFAELLKDLKIVCHFQSFVDPAELLRVWQIALAFSVQSFQNIIDF